MPWKFEDCVFSPKSCAHCGQSFVPTSGSAKFCSAKCHLLLGAVRQDDGCLIGRFHLDRYGYGQLTLAGSGRVNTTSHKVSYRENIGPIPPGMCVCHTCDNRACIEPSHFFLGTHGDNAADSARKGRRARGEGHPSNVLSEEKVHAILGDSRARRFVAVDYGVSRATVDDIRTGKSWGWLTGRGL
jgi:hypothetical protein